MPGGAFFPGGFFSDTNEEEIIMGWLYTYKPKGMSVAKFFEERWAGDGELYTRKLLDCAVVKLRTAYIAMECVSKETGNREVYAVVCLLEYAPHNTHNFGYKDMHETMEPYSYDAPARILDRLTPTNDPSALAWRAACRANLVRRQGIVEGATLLHPDGIRFTDGVTRTRFTVIQCGRYRRYRSILDGVVVKISDRVLRQMTIIINISDEGGSCDALAA